MSMAEKSKRILVTDAVGLVGAFIIRELLVDSPNANLTVSILAGYHSLAQVEAANVSSVSDQVKPILVDFDDENTYGEGVKEVDSILLLTPFTSAKAAQVSAWLRAISTNTGERSIHIVYIGVHTNSTESSQNRPDHEQWQLDAEDAIRETCASSSRLSFTMLRINFDGYNTILRPLRIAYYIPIETPFGWMAREDIARFAVQVLLKSTLHRGKTYVLSAESISLQKMAEIASRVTGMDVRAEYLDIAGFRNVALAAQKDDGYAAYIRSVAAMFEGLSNGKYPWHQESFPVVFESVVGKSPLSFEQWLSESEYKKRLLPTEP
jgi:uncharacterized protein YbjT (DUF2867 family)